MPISTIFTALFYPYIAHQRTSQNLISSVRSERSALFISMDRYRSSAHLANFQVRSSLNRSQKTGGSLSEKSAKTQNRS